MYYRPKLAKILFKLKIRIYSYYSILKPIMVDLKTWLWP